MANINYEIRDEVVKYYRLGFNMTQISSYLIIYKDYDRPFLYKDIRLIVKEFNVIRGPKFYKNDLSVDTFNKIIENWINDDNIQNAKALYRKFHYVPICNIIQAVNLIKPRQWGQYPPKEFNHYDY